jgi:hypothetical protein
VNAYLAALEEYSRRFIPLRACLLRRMGRLHIRIRRRDDESGNIRRLVRAEGSSDLICDGRYGFEVDRHRHRIGRSQMRKIAPRHDRGECPSVRNLSRRDGRHDILRAPFSNAGCIVGRQV